MKISEFFDGVQHIGLPTNCFDNTVDFYTSLGFKNIFSSSVSTGRVAFLEQGNLVIETYESEQPALISGAWDHVALSCNNIDAAFEIIKTKHEIISNGIEFLPFFSNGVRYFTFLGPNGEKVEFNQKL